MLDRCCGLRRGRMLLMRLWNRRWLWWVAGSGAVVAVGLGVWFWLSAGGRHMPPARARVYTAFSTCLLTGPRGLADGQVAPVWAGMEEASLATRAKVSYLPVAGPATVGAATPYLGSLVAQHCDVIIAVGAPETAAVNAGSGRFPGIQFVT